MSWINLKKAKCGKETALKQYIYNTFRSSSQMLYAFLGGDPDETISGATGKASLEGRWWFKSYQEPFLDWIFGKDHCKNVIEWDRGLLGLSPFYDRNKLKQMGFPQVTCPAERANHWY